MNEFVSPTYLYPAANAEENNEFSYLTDRDTIKRFVSELCNNVHHPVAVIDYQTLHESEEPEKLESMVEYFPMRRTCSVFRKCAGDDYCKKCDVFHAKLMNLDKEKIKEKIRQCAEDSLDFFYMEYEQHLPIILENFNRPVIEYHCPMLGYRELVFPLLYKDRIFGVIFAGQIMVFGEKDEDINKGIKGSFFQQRSPKELFSKYVHQYNDQAGEKDKLTCNRIRELIEKSDQGAKNYDDILGFRFPNQSHADYYSKNFSTEEEYHSFIRNVCVEIVKIETKIAEKYEIRRKDVFSRLISKISEKYFEQYEHVHRRSFKTSHDLRTAELKSAWDALRSFAKELRNKINLLEGIVVFGDGQNLKIEDSGRKSVVFSVPPKRKFQNESIELSSDYPKGISNHDNSFAKPFILNQLSVNLPKENIILIRCHDIAMLLHMKESEENRRLYEHLTNAIENELVRINSIVALCTANLLKEKFVLTLRMYRHENAHISTRLMNRLDIYFGTDGSVFIAENIEKRQSICNDLKNTVQLSSNIAENIGIVTGSTIKPSDLKKDIESIDVVDMLYKWQQMFHKELKNRNLGITVLRGGNDSSAIGFLLSENLKRNIFELTQNNSSYSEAPRSIEINSRLFELLIYNLVDNAVKYAYRGTNIYLIWIKRSDYYELCVTSFGPEMKQGEAMYGLYVRGDNNHNKIDGEGLGLYVVRRISDILRINVNHNSRKISSKNISLVPWFCKLIAPNISDDYDNKNKNISFEYDGLQAGLVINDYPNTKISEEDMTVEYLNKRIHMETWRTIFTVRIPF